MARMQTAPTSVKLRKTSSSAAGIILGRTPRPEMSGSLGANVLPCCRACHFRARGWFALAASIQRPSNDAPSSALQRHSASLAKVASPWAMQSAKVLLRTDLPLENQTLLQMID